MSPEEFEQIDFYCSLIDSLSSLEVHIIAFLNNPEGYLEIRTIDKNQVTGGFLEVLKNSFPRLTKEELNIATKSLFNRGILNTDLSQGAMTASQGLNLIRGRLTTGGTRLVEYASDTQNKL